MLFCQARAGARRGAAGDYVPLPRRTPRAGTPRCCARPSRRCAARPRSGPARYPAGGGDPVGARARRLGAERADRCDRRLYDGAASRCGRRIGARVSRACAIGATTVPRPGCAALAALDAARASRDYQPYWAALAHLAAAGAGEAGDRRARRASVPLGLGQRPGGADDS